MREEAIAAQPAREVSPIKKEVGEILDHVQKLSTQIAWQACEIFEENGRKLGLDLAPITGKRQAKEVPGTVCFERCPDRILRVVDLPSEVNAENALATLKNGILELVMPKVSVATKIPIESAKV